MMTDHYDGLALGAYTQPIRTSNATAQRWFDRGCVWLFAYHREEAAFCFGEAARADPACAMAHWGVAVANGPDYNFSAKAGFYAVAAQPEGYPSLNVATKAIATAKALVTSEGALPRERALVEALATRYEWPPTERTPELQEGYADAMERVAATFPEDADVQAVCAEALMCLAPWDLYEKEDGARTPNWYAADKRLRPIGVRVRRVLERGLRARPSHVWLCHLMIHLCEMGPVGAFDWAAAEVVRKCDATAAGHLVHMPTHLDIQVGEYARAMNCNVLGYQADLALYSLSPSRFGIYTGYVVHNMEFCVWAAMYAGCEKVAREAAEQIEGFFTEEV